MSPSTTPTPRRKRIISEVRLDELLTEVEKRAAIVKAAEAKRAAIVKAVTDTANTIYDEEVGGASEELVELQKELTEFLVQRRPALIRRLKSVINRPMGVVKFTERAAEMEWPKDEKALVSQIEKRLDAMNYLVVTKKLKKKAIAEGPEDLRAELRPYGAWKGKHLHITVKTPSMEEPLELEKRRINDRSSQGKQPE